MPPHVTHRERPAVRNGAPTADAATPVDTGQFLREAQAHQSQESDSDSSSSRPIVTQMPEGYVVVEQRVGRATAEWLLHVRCGCGHDFFEGEAMESIRCPGCGRMVALDIEPTRR